MSQYVLGKLFKLNKSFEFADFLVPPGESQICILIDFNQLI